MYEVIKIFRPQVLLYMFDLKVKVLIIEKFVDIQISNHSWFYWEMDLSRGWIATRERVWRLGYGEQILEILEFDS